MYPVSGSYKSNKTENALNKLPVYLEQLRYQLDLHKSLNEITLT